MILSLRRRGILIAAPLGLLAGLAAGLCAWVLLRSPRATAVVDEPSCVPARPCLALVIDDIGRDPAALDALLELPADLTFAVLPHAAHSTEARRAIQRAGRELLLHLPMDPLDRSRITDEPVVVGRDRPLAEVTQRCLRQVPEAVGVNNHMGSAATGDRVALVEVVRQLHGLFVLDSRTNEHSVFCQVARQVGLACVERDVFLDDPPAPAALTSAWGRALVLARQRGWAIAVAHPHGSTLEVLRDLLRHRQEVRVVRLSRLVARPGPT